jgi:1-acyl-sn-glycerol-3-phosphate acyltransferase
MRRASLSLLHSTVFYPGFSCLIAALARLFFGGLILVLSPGVPELGIYSAGSHGHYDRLRRSNFLLRNPFRLGDPKVMLHSGVTAKGHG